MLMEIDMTKDPAKEAFAEWAEDAMRQAARMPSRSDAFTAGWQYAVEYMENQNGRVEGSQEMEISTRG